MYSLTELSNTIDITLIGEERFMYDFRYVFDDLNIIKLLTGVEEAKLNIRMKRTLLVICARNSTVMKTELIDAGYTYGENLLLADDVIDMLLQPKSGRIAVWGAGEEGEKFISSHISEVKLVIDKWISLQEIHGKKIMRPAEVDLHNYYIIVATSKYWTEIKEELQALGLKEDLDFASYKGYVNPAQMLKECIYGNPTANLTCQYPFNFCQIIPDGYVLLCCLGLDVCIGGLKEKSFQDVWHSRLAKILRLSIINKTFYFCKEEPCPMIKSKQCYDYDSLFEPDDYAIKTPKWPNIANVSIDHTCNLACDHCRKEILVAKDAEREQIDIIAEKLNEVIPNVKHLVLAGNGEIFFSETYQRMWKGAMGERRNSISILTNGLLFSPDIWNQLKRRYLKIGFGVSIDAATEKTYKLIRRGGNFKLLMKTMYFLGSLRRSGEIWYLHMNFVVRQDNVDELKDFILWAKRIGADRVRVSKVENWIYDNDRFYEEISVFNEDNTLKREFSTAFSDSISDPIVEMVNLKLK